MPKTTSRNTSIRSLTPLILLFAPLSAEAEGGSVLRADTLHSEAVHPIEEVVVTTSHHPIEPRLSALGAVVIDQKQLKESHRSSLLMTLAEQVPGLFVTQRGVMGCGVSTGAAGGISLRGVGGSPTTGVLLVVDGQPQYSGLMGHPIADNLQSLGVEQVEVVRGPASVCYGSNAMGGVIHITTKAPKREGAELLLRGGYGSYNTLESALRAAWRKGPFSLALEGLCNTSEGHRPNMDFTQYGATLRMGVALSPRWQISALGELIHFDASNPGSVSKPLIDNDSQITRSRFALTLDNRYETLFGSLSLFYNFGRHRINDGYAIGEEPLDYRFRSSDHLWGLSLHEGWSYAPQSRLTVGFDLFGFGGRAWNLFLADGHREPIADKRAYEVAAYLNWRQALTRRLRLDLGLRLDHHTHAGTEWVPALALTAQLPAHIELRGSLSKGFRFPTIREMYLFPSQNPDLKAERMWSYEVAFTQRLHPIRYSLNLYYIDGKNRIQTLMVEGRPRNLNTGRIANWGVEGELSATFAKWWSLMANYSYLHMRYPVVAAPEHKLYSALAFSRGRWSLQTALQYVVGLYTELQTASHPGQKEEFLLWSLRGSLRLGNLVTLWLRGENLLGQHYQINAGFPMPGATVQGGVELTF